MLVNMVGPSASVTWAKAKLEVMKGEQEVTGGGWAVASYFSFGTDWPRGRCENVGSLLGQAQKGALLPVGICTTMILRSG
jgi:hypothetical protein